MSKELVRTKEGTQYLNGLYKTGALSSVPRYLEDFESYMPDEDSQDFTELAVLVWAGDKKHPLIPENLKKPNFREAVRRLFEAGYLKYKD